MTLQWTLCILSLKWTLSVATSVVCWVFVPLCSCFSEKGKLGLLWPVRSHMFLIICGGMQVLARMAPSLWLSSGSRCLGFYLPYYSAWCLLMSCLPCGSSGSSAANHFLHSSLLLQLLFSESVISSFALTFWITNYPVKLCRFKDSSMMISTAPYSIVIR